jgi:hypothetical protein
MIRLLAFLAVAATLCAQKVAPPDPAGIGEAEVRQVEEKVAAVRRDLLSKYELSLGELQLQFQKAADLESAVAVRSERERVRSEGSLGEQNIVGEPKALRTLQQSTLSKMQELVAAVVTEAVPRLVEFKKQLTVEGKLDDALAVRAAIERVQNANVPVIRAEAGSIVQAETLMRAYHADRSRADKTYKGVRFVVRGTMGGYRIDPENARSLILYVTGSGSGGWVQCYFRLDQWRYREDRQGAVSVLVLSSREGSDVKLLKGQQVDILGDCTGWDETVKLAKCDLAR